MAPGSTPGFHEDVHPQFIAQGGPPSVLVGREAVPLRHGSLLEVGSIDCHRAVVEHAVHAQSALEDDLWRWRRRRCGGEDGLKKR
jgi:hypothetical protein